MVLPKGMGRSEAIEKRIKEAGIARAIRVNQVRALGYIDAATNYMESSIGGGGVQDQLTDWSGRKLNESDEDFIHRCVDTVKSITEPKQKQVVDMAPTVTYRRKR